MFRRTCNSTVSAHHRAGQALGNEKSSAYWVNYRRDGLMTAMMNLAPLPQDAPWLRAQRRWRRWGTYLDLEKIIGGRAISMMKMKDHKTPRRWGSAILGVDQDLRKTAGTTDRDIVPLPTRGGGSVYCPKVIVIGVKLTPQTREYIVCLGASYPVWHGGLCMCCSNPEHATG